LLKLHQDYKKVHSQHSQTNTQRAREREERKQTDA